MKKPARIAIGVGVAIVIGVVALRAVRSQRSTGPKVRAEVVTPRDLVSHVNASGHIEAKQSVDISADISGRIVQLPVEEGQRVREGDLLLVIDPTQYEAAVRQSEALLAQARAGAAQAKANYDQAQRDWDRLRELKNRTPDLVTDQEVEQTRTKADVQKALWESAQHNVSQQQASVEEAKDRLDKTVIRSPINGEVTRRNVEKGETAIVGTMNNPGSLLLTVSDPSVMEAVVEVDETDIPMIRDGDSASVEIDAWPDSAFSGRVVKVASSAMQDRSSRTATASQSTADQAVDFEVRIQIDHPPRGIRPDLSATADIVTATRKNVLSVPIIALTLRDTTKTGPAPDSASTGEPSEAEGVFQIQGDEVHFRTVRVGIAGDAYFEVLEGIAEGDTVVSGPYKTVRELQDGGSVRIEKVDRGSGSAAGSDTAAAGGDTIAARGQKQGS
jgi:HlyD family secretion protein